MKNLRRNSPVLRTALAIGQSASEAARLSGLGRRTVERYLADENFRAEIERLSEEILRQLTAKAAEDVQASLQTVRDIRDEAINPSDRLRAAAIFLQHSMRFLELRGRHIDAEIQAELRQLRENLKMLTETIPRRKS
jgi:hypothetical protein